MIPLWMALSASAATCSLDAPADAPFEIPVGNADRVRLLVELWLSPDSAPWATAMLDVLDAQRVPGVVVVPLKLAPVDASLAAVLARAAAGPHEVAVALDEREVPRDILGNARDLKVSLKDLTPATGKLKVLVAPIGSKGSEALLGRAGFRALINLDGPPVATPRYAGHFEGQPILNIVLHAGTYEGPCGGDPRVGPFTPKAADRASEVLQRAQRERTPVVRVSIDGARGGPDDATVLTRWLAQIVGPSGATVSTANDARQAVLRDFRRGVVEDAKNADAGGGRLLSPDELQQAAAGLSEGTRLPRVLPGELTPTEAFFAFVTYLDAGDVDSAVRIGALSGPGSIASTSLTGATEIDRGALVALASALAGAMPAEVPAALPVDGRLLTATEILVALGSAVRGDDPVLTRPMAVPDPNERGLGWGVAELP